MGWWAHLTDDRGHTEGDWNYTHNCAVMAWVALDTAGQPVPEGESWWMKLSGLPGPEGAAYLHTIVRELETDPDRYRAMNPSNGWGDYDSFLATLVDMRNAVPEWPTTWHASG